MSLKNESCQKCWLPPLDNSPLCRKCSVSELLDDGWIRYHRPSPEGCRKLRALALHYKGVVVPERCIQCCAFLAMQNETWLSAVKSYITTTSRLPTVILDNQSHSREGLLEALATLMENCQPLSLKICNALKLCNPAREHWILEELIIRPQFYGALLDSPLRIPPHMSEDLWETHPEVDGWWSFWEGIPLKTKRRISFHCMTFKEELLEKTWHPDRVTRWCFDIEEVADLVCFKP